jgi:hypothetical protein
VEEGGPGNVSRKHFTSDPPGPAIRSRGAVEYAEPNRRPSRSALFSLSILIRWVEGAARVAIGARSCDISVVQYTMNLEARVTGGNYYRL